MINDVQKLFLLIFNIIVLTSFVILFSNTYAFLYPEVHEKTLYEITNQSSSKQIAHIPVGNAPETIGVNSHTNMMYVANYLDNTVSVIDGENNTKIGNDIPVGKGPGDIGVNSDTNTIYVANNWDNSVSVIDGKANKVVAKVTFSTEPFNGGRIECDKDKLTAPIGEPFYVYSGSQCTAKSNQGFEFVSWQENLGGNSTQLLKFSSPSSIVDSILDFFNMKPDKQEATLNITKFGSFTANFKALPPPIPTQYVATLITIVANAFIGSWLTPTVIEWRNRRKQVSKLDHCHNEAKNLYNDGKLDSNDIEKLNKLKDKITDEYTKGKINKEQYDKLGNEISISYREIFTKEINSLNTISNNDKVEQLSRIKTDIEDAYAKGKINELHHTLLKERLANYEKIK
ncbi:MAG: YncE family protein [Nitrososphaeraceae archaeon]